MDDKDEWVERAFGYKLGGADGDGTAEASRKPDDDGTGLAAWQKARAEAVAALTELDAAIRAMEDPDGDAAIIELRSIRANLTERPETPQQVAELVKSLNTDGVVEDAELPNGFGITINLRDKLLPILESMSGVVGAAA